MREEGGLGKARLRESRESVEVLTTFLGASNRSVRLMDWDGLSGAGYHKLIKRQGKGSVTAA